MDDFSYHPHMFEELQGDYDGDQHETGIAKHAVHTLAIDYTRVDSNLIYQGALDPQRGCRFRPITKFPMVHSISKT